jgi:hypothetical protein
VAAPVRRRFSFAREASGESLKTVSDFQRMIPEKWEPVFGKDHAQA